MSILHAASSHVDCCSKDYYIAISLGSHGCFACCFFLSFYVRLSLRHSPGRAGELCCTFRVVSPFISVPETEEPFRNQFCWTMAANLLEETKKITPINKECARWLVFEIEL